METDDAKEKKSGTKGDKIIQDMKKREEEDDLATREAKKKAKDLSNLVDANLPKYEALATVQN